jgi:hypothetical protein
MLKTARDIVAKAKKNGMTDDQVQKADLLAPLNKTWLAPGSAAPPRFQLLVYRSVP